MHFLLGESILVVYELRVQSQKALAVPVNYSFILTIIRINTRNAKFKISGFGADSDDIHIIMLLKTISRGIRNIAFSCWQFA